MTGAELREKLSGMSLAELLTESADWIADANNAMWEGARDEQPSEGMGKCLAIELRARAENQP